MVNVSILIVANKIKSWQDYGFWATIFKVFERSFTLKATPRSLI